MHSYSSRVQLNKKAPREVENQRGHESREEAALCAFIGRTHTGAVRRGGVHPCT